MPKFRSPDFTKLFHEYFGNTPKKVRYRIGWFVEHDIVFMSSLIHDALFKRSDVQLKSKRLTIPLERDCWELQLHQERELFVAKSKLTISPVQSVRWEYEKDRDLRLNDDLQILHLVAGFGDYYRGYLDHAEHMDFIIQGDRWICRIQLPADDYNIRLQDLETPWLYSERCGSQEKISQ